MLKGSSEIATLACHSIRENREYFGLEQTKSEKATVITEGNMGYPKKHRGRRKMGSKKRRARKKNKKK